MQPENVSFLSIEEGLQGWDSGLGQMLFLYFRILGKIIPKVQPSPDAGGSATRWAQEWVGLLAVEMYYFKVF